MPETVQALSVFAPLHGGGGWRMGVAADLLSRQSIRLGGRRAGCRRCGRGATFGFLASSKQILTTSKQSASDDALGPSEPAQSRRLPSGSRVAAPADLPSR
ncbi:hypothetical protein Franean1_0748 [Parafrankia sp. EAN1pec]|nr:hypothetical protein Franean1_0748 [Frankia sp. EAN1pec]